MAGVRFGQDRISGGDGAAVSPPAAELNANGKFWGKNDDGAPNGPCIGGCGSGIYCRPSQDRPCRPGGQRAWSIVGKFDSVSRGL
jgi:hypothetical protein